MDQSVTSTVAWARLLLEAMAERGIDPVVLCEKAGIDIHSFDKNAERVPSDFLTKLWEEAERISGDKDLGLHVGESLRPRAVNVVSYLLLSSATAREGIERVIRYHDLISGAFHMAIRDEDEVSELEIGLVGGDLPRGRHQMEYLSVIILKISQWVTGEGFSPVEIRFRHKAPDDTSEHERIFGCPVTFEARHNSLVIDRESLDQPSEHADPEMLKLHEEFADRHMAGLGADSIVRKVKTHLAAVLEQGPRDLESIATRLHMSPRTLQRRLAADGVSFQEVLDSIRQDVCMAHLEDSNMTVGDIAYLAGFADPSTFYRAFKKWTGKTPLEHREAHRSKEIADAS